MRRDLRYRAGRLLRRQGIGLVVFVVVGVPLALLLDWRDGSFPSWPQTAFLAGLFSLGICGIYAWSVFARQDWSESRRAYRIQNLESADDPEVSAAKRILFSSSSDRSDRETAVQFLVARGEARPNEVSLTREIFVMAAVFAGVLLLFVLVVWFV